MNSPQSKHRWEHGILVACGAMLVLYCISVLVYVVTSPDLRIRCLLFEESAAGPDKGGIVIQGTPGLECKGLSPKPGDVLLTIADHHVSTFQAFANALNDLRHASVPPGGQLDEGADPSELGELLPSLVAVGDGKRLVEVQYWSTDLNARVTTWLLIQSLPFNEILVSFCWLLLQLGIFAVSALAVWHRPFDRSARIFFMMCIATLVAFLGGFHWWVLAGNSWLNFPFVICAVFVPVVSLHFFLIYPAPKSFLVRWPRTVMASLYFVPSLASVILVALIVAERLLMPDPLTNDPVESFVSLQSVLRALQIAINSYLYFAAACFVGLLVSLGHAFVLTRNPIERNQLKWLLWAGVIASVPLGYSLGLALFDRVSFVLGAAQLPMFLASLAFMLAYAVCIVRYKLMLLDQIVTKSMMYYAASLALTVAFGLTVVLGSAAANRLNKALSSQQALQQSFSLAAILMLMTILLLWIRDQVQQMVDRRFYREKYQLDKALQHMNRAVGHLVDRQSLAHRMLGSCQDVLRVERAALYLRDAERETFQLIAAEQSEDIPLQFSASEELLDTLKRESALHRNAPGLRSGASNALRTMHAELLYAMEFDEDIAGLVVLGEKEGSTSYTAEDLTFLNALAQITSVALRSAKVHQDFGRLNDELRVKVDKISEQNRQIAMLQAELTQSNVPIAPRKNDAFRRDPIKGNSDAILRVLETVRKVADSESSVLIHGESGTGKELLAQAIHDNSPRRDGPMIRVHCASLSPSLLESELFGHVKGAFTGAHRDRVGRFELANGGTLFLDEIGDISLETQVKLLRVLQERSFEPVGGSRTINVDVRLITATHQNLEKLIQEGRFREDLFYRLNVISVTLPPLRERREDIFELALHFLKSAAQRAGKRVTYIQEDVLDVMKEHDWRGNIRELENAIERAVVLAESDHITLDDLPPEFRLRDSRPKATRMLEVKPTTEPGGSTQPPADYSPIGEKKLEEDGDERERLLRALAEADGNKAHAARLLGLARSTYFSKLKKYDIS